MSFKDYFLSEMGRYSIQLDDEKIKQMYQDGATSTEIGKQLGVTDDTILNRLKAMGVKRRPRGSHGYIQLDDEKIKQMYEAGASSTEIGRQLGVTYITILRRLKAMGVEPRPRGVNPLKRGSDLRNRSQMRTRNITGKGNVGADHQTFYGSPKTVSTNRPGPMRGGSH